MTPQEMRNTPGPDRARKADGTFGPLLIGIGLLLVAMDAFVTGGFRVSLLGGLLVIVGCTERLIGALRATQDSGTPADAPRRTPSER
ncbi:hypothetical protein [Arthrobacter woluwensis]|uniref:Uncharacterized protein n=1 Tax=Arthrobacter woluwensis TaxID=156980 RepID=A0A1H4S066_9MICC|nr:hypothetical protein [Arthrobacter woluwensis]SEC37437.1 hypothetical protein SAMN04489745_2705 [Arthrobacter woluwensis]